MVSPADKQRAQALGSAVPRRVRLIIWVPLGLFLVVYGSYLLLPWISNISVAYWWFESLNLSQTFLTRLSAQLLLGGLGFLLAFAIFGWVFHHAYRIFLFDPRHHGRRWAGYLGVFITSLLAGYLFSRQYPHYLLWKDHASFGRIEPIFGKSYDFYVFTLPFLQMWTGYLATLLLISLALVGLIAASRSTQRIATKKLPTAKPGEIILVVFIALFLLPFLTGLFQGFGLGGASVPLALGVIGYGLHRWWKKKGGLSGGWSIIQPAARANPADSARNHGFGFGLVAGRLFGLLLLLWVVTSWLARYDLLYSGHSTIVPTAGWLDVTLITKYYWVQAAFFLVWGFTILFGRLANRPHAAIGTLFLTIWLLGLFGVPALVRSVYVRPNELLLETPFISDHISATRYGFNLDLIQEVALEPHAALTADDIASAPATLANIRVWDYRAFETANDQLQSLQTYYSFDDADVDRYVIDSQARQLLVSARELHLDQLPPSQGDQWLLPLSYTYSYGLTAASANVVTDQGRPDYLLKDIPPVAAAPALEMADPRMYFGEASRSGLFLYSGIPEIDPASITDTAGESDNPLAGAEVPTSLDSTMPSSHPSGTDEDITVYDNGFRRVGIPMDSFWKRLMFAFHQGFSANTLFSKYLTSDTEYLLNRTLSDRLEALAPFIDWDSDPYPVVTADGVTVWVVDGYTRTAYLPLSARQGDAAYNYQRNSVKATVNALTGETHLYLWDTSDPLILSWQTIYPELFDDAAEIPADILAHLRFPIDGFDVQTNLYNRYHVTDPFTFYTREDVWRTPNEVIQQGGVSTPMEAYYNIVNLPGFKRNGGEFTLLRPATPFAKENMTAMYAGRSDDPYTGELVVYRLPTTTLVAGPSQIATRIDQDPELSKNFSLWNQEGSEVIRGGMYVLPVGQTMLYVQPIYLQARTNPIPELRLVVLATDTQLVFAPTAQEALAKLNVLN